MSGPAFCVQKEWYVALYFFCKYRMTKRVRRPERDTQRNEGSDCLKDAWLSALLLLARHNPHCGFCPRCVEFPAAISRHGISSKLDCSRLTKWFVAPLRPDMTHYGLSFRATGETSHAVFRFFTRSARVRMTNKNNYRLRMPTLGMTRHEKGDYQSLVNYCRLKKPALLAGEPAV